MENPPFSEVSLQDGDDKEKARSIPLGGSEIGSNLAYHLAGQVSFSLAV